MSKCIYCDKEIGSDQYQGDDGWVFDIEVKGIECNVMIHRACLAKVVGEYVTEKVCGPRQALREMEE